MKSRRGFSITELAVCVGVVLILLALLLPVINRQRERSRVARCLSNIRQSTALVGLFANDHDDQVPNVFAGRGDSISRTRIDGEFEQYEQWYSRAKSLWYLAALDESERTPYPPEYLLCDRPADARAFIDEARKRYPGGAYPLNYVISFAYYLDPAALDPRSPSALPRFFRTQRLSNTAYPSAKALVFEAQPRHDQQFQHLGYSRMEYNYREIVGATDGAASERMSKDAVIALDLSPRPDPLRTMLVSDLNRYSTTPNGIHGTDW